MFGGNFAIFGYAFCNGQILPIDQNTALFSLIGTTYGGDGITTFSLPNLQSRVPYHQGSLAGGATYAIGEMSGFENVTIAQSQMPIHTHQAQGNANDGSQPSPANGFWGLNSSNVYSATAPASPMNNTTIGITGGNQPHENMLPFLCVNFLIALEGIFPSRN